MNLSKTRLHALDMVDDMSPELRACVHEFGLAIVVACLNSGVRNPAQIRQLVVEIWRGARHSGQRTSKEAVGVSVLALLDWLLIQAGAQLSAAKLQRVLFSSCWTIAPLVPTNAMIEASMATITMGDRLVNKREKHRLRLEAALRAGAKQLNGELSK